MAGPLLKGLQFFWKMVRSNICSILASRAVVVEFDQNFESFQCSNQYAQFLRCKFPACRARPLLKGLQIWQKQANKNFGPFSPQGPRWENLIKISSLFNTQTNMFRASLAIFHSMYCRPSTQGASIFWKMDRSKILLHFGLRAVVVVFDQNFKSFQLIDPIPPLQVSIMQGRPPIQGASNLVKTGR